MKHSGDLLLCEKYVYADTLFNCLHALENALICYADTNTSNQKTRNDNKVLLTAV